jgi:outer membrane murein-binding lipoprotein Lpp
MEDHIPLREKVRRLENDVTTLKARVAILENQHLFGVAQMNRIEETQASILHEVSKIMPTQAVIDDLTAKLNAAADKADAAKVS